ncbi:MAG TPA: hypothetical protein VM915_11845 [Verrucomicrobiae bacterium]|jgi:P-type conjugative transfer protein TrbJ|nr:hypothetical protein [Verrucomicrobiae bacterium]
MKWKIVGLVMAVFCVSTAPDARAQMAVVDNSNLAQSIRQVAHAIEQIKNQVRQIEQSAQMLAANPLQMSHELRASLTDAQALLDQAEGLAFEADRLGEEIAALYPQTWEDQDLEHVLAQSDLWLAETRGSLERAMAAEARASRSIAQSNTRIERALRSSTDAQGQTGAIQASNQLLGVSAAQLAEIHALIAAQGRALQTERLERAARDARARELRARAFPEDAPRPATPARQAF